MKSKASGTQVLERNHTGWRLTYRPRKKERAHRMKIFNPGGLISGWPVPPRAMLRNCTQRYKETLATAFVLLTRPNGHELGKVVRIPAELWHRR